jgi:hypothetical protein
MLWYIYGLNYTVNLTVFVLVGLNISFQGLNAMLVYHSSNRHCLQSGRVSVLCIAHTVATDDRIMHVKTTAAPATVMVLMVVGVVLLIVVVVVVLIVLLLVRGLLGLRRLLRRSGGSTIAYGCMSYVLLSVMVGYVFGFGCH